MEEGRVPSACQIGIEIGFNTKKSRKSQSVAMATSWDSSIKMFPDMVERRAEFEILGP